MTQALSPAFLLDLVSTLRTLRQRPSFTLAAVVTLALGIGAKTAMFSVVDTLLLEPLPYLDPECRVAMWPARSVANREIDFLRREGKSYREVAGWSPGWLMTFTGGAIPRQVSAARVSGNLFALFGARAAIGRTFGLEAEIKGQDHVAVLGYELWRSALRGDPEAVG